MRQEISPTITAGTYTMASAWLSNCASMHHTCGETLSGAVVEDGQGGAPTLPTRTIELQPGEPPRVSTNRGARSTYAALSYCWGTSEVLKLTKKELINFQTRLPLESMPRTIYESLEVTRNLDIKHLWVDSLCIVQDDDEDWEHEAKKMGNVYQNATVTIAVLGTRTSKSGFLDRVTPMPLVRMPWSLGMENQVQEPADSLGSDAHLTQPLDCVECVITDSPYSFQDGIFPIGLEQQLRSSTWNQRG